MGWGRPCHHRRVGRRGNVPVGNIRSRAVDRLHLLAFWRRRPTADPSFPRNDPQDIRRNTARVVSDGVGCGRAIAILASFSNQNEPNAHINIGSSWPNLLLASRLSPRLSTHQQPTLTRSISRNVSLSVCETSPRGLHPTRTVCDRTNALHQSFCSTRMEEHARQRACRMDQRPQGRTSTKHAPRPIDALTPSVSTHYLITLLWFRPIILPIRQFLQSTRVVRTSTVR
jgi:hypothetical protein